MTDTVLLNKISLPEAPPQSLVIVKNVQFSPISILEKDIAGVLIALSPKSAEKKNKCLNCAALIASTSGYFCRDECKKIHESKNQELKKSKLEINDMTKENDGNGDDDDDNDDDGDDSKDGDYLPLTVQPTLAASQNKGKICDNCEKPYYHYRRDSQKFCCRGCFNDFAHKRKLVRLSKKNRGPPKKKQKMEPSKEDVNMIPKPDVKDELPKVLPDAQPKSFNEYLELMKKSDDNIKKELEIKEKARSDARAIFDKEKALILAKEQLLKQETNDKEKKLQDELIEKQKILKEETDRKLDEIRIELAEKDRKIKEELSSFLENEKLFS